MSDPAFSLCVYLGSRPGNNPLFIEAAKQTGRWIGEHQGQLIYGGGNSGLMGMLGGLLSGYTWDDLGAAWTFTIGSGFALAGLLWLLFGWRSRSGAAGLAADANPSQ